RHRRFRLVLAERRERGAEARGIAIDDGHAELGLRWKMIMDARLGEAERVRDVLIAEGAVAARLDQRLGEVEDLLGRCRWCAPLAGGTGSRHDRRRFTPLNRHRRGPPPPPPPPRRKRAPPPPHQRQTLHTTP